MQATQLMRDFQRYEGFLAWYIRGFYLILSQPVITGVQDGGALFYIVLLAIMFFGAGVAWNAIHASRVALAITDDLQRAGIQREFESYAILSFALYMFALFMQDIVPHAIVWLLYFASIVIIETLQYLQWRRLKAYLREK